MVKLFICLGAACIVIGLTLIQPSYTNDQLHSLINPSEPNFSRREKKLMITTGVAALVFIVTVCLVTL
ncbi:hypothetical protein ACI3E1_07325 [Ligilactobacillus sp. LYQ139]|uniref:hypothetical protein n=1 Tax=Ligilactobacillus sp. LYQ139 TaxID=3378800 RepID=UPI0038546B62